MEIEERLQKVESKIELIRERNVRVEAEKAWETSWFRVILLSVVTYFTASIILLALGVTNFFFAALVPAAGYFLSVQSLPTIKKWWIRKESRAPRT
ncbi:MAG: hypothetical protein V4437_03395 [Patescibacteria group bacterium]